ncbi:MAG: ABC transporter substrate-binding protein [Anaerolineales bacterium]
MKKFALIITLLALSLTGCGLLPGTTSQGQNLEITDSTGHTVLLESVPQRIAIAGKATFMLQDAIFLFQEANQRVVALENRKQSVFSFLPVVDPTISDKEIFEANVGPEQIAAAQPDLVLLKSYMVESLGDPLEQLNIPVIYLDLETTQAFYEDIHTLGQVFGNPDRADEIVNYYQERVSQVQDLVSSAESEPSVLILEYSEDGGEVAFSVPPVSWLQTTLVETAGGIPIWSDLDVSGGWTVVNLEQIAAWDPDQIYIIDYAGAASQVVEDLRQNPIWSNLKAVQTDQMYAFPYDFYSWDQPDTRWILGLEWLATQIHPEQTAGIDIMAEVRSFYTEMYFLDKEAIDAQVMPKLTGDIP